MSYGIIYKATNVVNGKVYIGQTIKTLKERKEQHLYNSKDESRLEIFYKAIRKYGESSFCWEVIDEAENKKELDEKESFYIKNLKSYAFSSDGHGYNMTFGGEGSEGFKHSKESIEKIRKNRAGLTAGKNNHFFGKKHTEEARKKMSIAKDRIFNGENNPMYKRNHTDEAKRKISIARKGVYKGKKNPMFGKKHTEETKEKIRRANEEYRKNNIHQRARAVLKFDLDGNFVSRYDTVKEGAESVNGDTGAIRKCCKGIYKQSKGYKWRYEDEYVGDLNVRLTEN